MADRFVSAVTRLGFPGAACRDRDPYLDVDGGRYIACGQCEGKAVRPMDDEIREAQIKVRFADGALFHLCG
jgi:predicted PP-loop superfamily ATPase